MMKNAGMDETQWLERVRSLMRIIQLKESRRQDTSRLYKALTELLKEQRYTGNK